jgi:nucleoid-associated protein YgaU
MRGILAGALFPAACLFLGSAAAQQGDSPAGASQTSTDPRHEARIVAVEDDPLAAGLAGTLGQLASLERQLAACQSRLQESLSAEGERVGACPNLADEVAQLKMAVRDAQALKDEVLSENVKIAGTLEQERAAAENRGLQLDQRIAEVEMERDGALSSNLGLQAKMRELEQKRASLEELLKEQKNLVESGRASLNASEARAAAIAEERAELEQRLSASRAQVAEIQQETAIARKAEREGAVHVAELSETIDRLKAQLALQVRVAEEARAQVEASEVLAADLDAARAQLAAEKLKFEDRLASLRARHQEAQEEGAKAQAATREENVALSADNQELKAALSRSEELAGDLEQRMSLLEETHAGALAAMEKLRADKSVLDGEITAKREAVENLSADLEAERATVGELRMALSGEKEALAESRTALGQERQNAGELEARLAKVEQSAAEDAEELRRQVEASGAERDLLQGALTESKTECDSLRGQLEDAKADLTEVAERLPVSSGGTRTDEQIRNEAAERLADLKAHQRQQGRMNRGEWRLKRSRLEADVLVSQLQLAESTGARGVYRVQQDDTLAGISRDFYGKSSAWSRIYEANRHMLKSPDRVFPGATLIVP